MRLQLRPECSFRDTAIILTARRDRTAKLMHPAVYRGGRKNLQWLKVI